jgi:hypothetical protein
MILVKQADEKTTNSSSLPEMSELTEVTKS